jgi:hypothetical protein
MAYNVALFYDWLHLCNNNVFYWLIWNSFKPLWTPQNLHFRIALHRKIIYVSQFTRTLFHIQMCWADEPRKMLENAWLVQLYKAYIASSLGRVPSRSIELKYFPHLHFCFLIGFFSTFFCKMKINAFLTMFSFPRTYAKWWTFYGSNVFDLWLNINWWGHSVIYTRRLSSCSVVKMLLSSISWLHLNVLIGPGHLNSLPVSDLSAIQNTSFWSQVLSLLISFFLILCARTPNTIWSL